MYNLEYNYHQHKYLLVFININYMATYSDLRLVTFTPVHDMKIKLQMTSQSNHKMNMQLWFYFYAMYWIENDQTLVKTCSHVIYMNKKQLNSCTDGKCTLSYNNIQTMEVYNKSCLMNKWANKFLTVASCVP